MFLKKMFKEDFAKELSQSQKGFSLVEILVALTLLGIAGTFVVGKIFDQLEDGKLSATSIQISGFKSQLKEFRRRCGFYPTTEQGLEALIDKPEGGRDCKRYPPEGFIDGDSIPDDPWDAPYEYVLEGNKPNIISAGPDGDVGTDDDIALLKGRRGDDE